jgi:heme/copper-type cytochrome/quinol oxidase subunit 2
MHNAATVAAIVLVAARVAVVVVEGALHASNSEGEDGGLTKHRKLALIIVGSVVGGILVLALIVALIIICVNTRRKAMAKAPSPSPPPSSPPVTEQVELETTATAKPSHQAQ